MNNQAITSLLRSMAVCVLLLPGVAAAQVKTKLTDGGPTLRISQGPPANNSDVKLAPPSPKHVWLAGYWDWENDHYVWVKGRWEAPRDNLVWVAPHWAGLGKLWNFYPGQWVKPGTPPPPPDAAAPSEQTPDPAAADRVTTLLPPAKRVEIPPAAPSAKHVWSAGYWTVSGDHFIWVPGFWLPKQNGMTWEHPHWRQVGKEWHLLPGSWRKV